MRTAAKLLRFPSAGVARDIAYREATTPNEAQAFATPHAMNMRGEGTLEDRSRGGSRPGLVEMDTEGVILVDQHEQKTITGLAIGTTISATAVYRGRHVCASGTTWYMSAIGEPTNWTFNGDSEDPSRAVAGNLAFATSKGESITALIPFRDHLLFAATKHTLWLIAGDPHGGVRCISEHVGCISRDAWCTDGNTIWVMASGGMYALPVEPGNVPTKVSGRIPEELKGLDSAIMAYSCKGNMVMAFCERGNDHVDWAYDAGAKSFWQDDYTESHRPTAVYETALNNEFVCVLKGTDGTYRTYDDDADDDDGDELKSMVFIGPVRVSQRDDMDGMVGELTATIAEGSDDVSISVYTAHSPEAAVSAAREGTAAHREFVAKAGYNNVWRPRQRGAWAVFELSSNGRWAYESMTAVMKMTGRLR